MSHHHPTGACPQTVAAGGCLHPDHREVVRYFEMNRVYTVQIESCLLCTQGCRYCYAAGADAPSTELSAECIGRVITEAAEIGVRAIDWLGGDPLLRGDWAALAGVAEENGLFNNIWTSGIPLADPKVAEDVAAMTGSGFVSVHLDSLNEAIYGTLHNGEPGPKIQAILDGVENLFAAGKRADQVINCITFTRPLAGDDLEETIRFFSAKGIRTCLTQICMAGLGREHPEWVPSREEVGEAVRLRDRIDYPGSDFSMGTMDVNRYYCGGMVCVTVEGEVTPCSVIRQGFGNVNDRPLGEIITDHQSDLLFLPLRNESTIRRCGACKNRQVCWGCRATAFYTSGDLMADDPNCPGMEELVQ
ncbi:radical SAM/SPASM domain-containing protein [Methanosphaerula palustris]|uniref:radical SAM/SPASM domain-containing protein n=1 Tax=Methanosphaerula palustris TaxID=475088 RepID=UPI000322A369|nr:radical SAM protein [Methanosphaerula palustris]